MNTKDLSGIAIVERMKWENTVGKRITILDEIRRKAFDRVSSLTPRKVKETIHLLKNRNQFNKISYMLPEMRLPNLR